MSVILKITIAAAVALLVGLVVGFFIGRVSLESRWSQPYATVGADDAAKAAANDADPTPPAGTKVLKPMPIGKARAVLATMTKADPVVSPGASFGADDNGFELHVTLENHGKCKVTAARGVAYGFGPKGMPAAANKNGEQYVAFKLEAPLEPGKKAVASAKLRYADMATLAVAHVDATECADGPAWKRQ